MSKKEQDSKNLQAYWKANVTLITVLLVIWATVSYGFAIILAPFLNQFNVGQIPMGFWWAQQGSMYTFVILIFAYALIMDRIDAKHNMKEE